MTRLMQRQGSRLLSDGCDIWAVIPAAGIGRRMQSEIPKQYLKLNGRPVLEHTLDRLLSVDAIHGAVVALQNGDPYWSDVQVDTTKPVVVAEGGNERCQSVLNALKVLAARPEYIRGNTWALVHDAVRPCISIDDMQNLIARVAGTESGGLLATPVRDTMKRQDDHQAVQQTIDRTGLWHALTPQLFSCDRLSAAIASALADGYVVTDESSAMEHAGYHPKLVPGREDNIKITRPADLRLAELYLQAETSPTQSTAQS